MQFYSYVHRMWRTAGRGGYHVTWTAANCRVLLFRCFVQEFKNDHSSTEYLREGVFTALLGGSELMKMMVQTEQQDEVGERGNEWEEIHNSTEDKKIGRAHV